jgi:hypothetical protein
VQCLGQLSTSDNAIGHKIITFIIFFFNQKDGLEHFTAIGVLFGPHPELAWRQTIVECLEKAMKADITIKDCQKLQSTIQEPNIVILIVPQQVSNL